MTIFSKNLREGMALRPPWLRLCFGPPRKFSANTISCDDYSLHTAARKAYCQVMTRGGRNHIFRLRLRFCSKILEYESSSNLRIWLLFKLRQPSNNRNSVMFVL